MNNITSKTDYREQLNDKGSIVIIPTGNSMWPIIKNKNNPVIITKKTNRLKKFDVAFYLRDGVKYVLHRVVEVKEDGYVMQGDGQNFTEEIGENEVFGVLDGMFVGKKYVSVKDEKYQRKVKNWYNRKLIRKIRLKLFLMRIKNGEREEK